MAEHSRSGIRNAVVWDAVQAVLRARHDLVASSRPLQVVDLGGGTGGLAVRVAELGHRVTVVDPSPDALASLERRADEAGVTEAVRGVLGDAGTLLDVVGPASTDVVVCHGVLEVLDEPDQALRSAAAVLVPGGYLSVLATQRAAAVFSRAVAGHLAEARAMLAEPDDGDRPPRRFTRSRLEALLADAGFEVRDVHGVRVFIDHISSAVVDSDPAAVEDLRALEAAASTHADFLPLATHLHLLAVLR